MESRRFRPDAAQFSTLTALVLLAFALTHLINSAPLQVSIPLLGVLLRFQLNLGSAIVLSAALLAAAGVDRMLRSHPSIQPGETSEHWLLPMLTVLILGVTLNTLPGGAIWWLGFALAALLLVGVFLAEFIVVDPTDVRFGLASAGVTALSYALFAILAIAVHQNGLRLFLLLPAVFAAGGLISLRTLHLRLNERWEFAWAAGVALVVTQVAAALHYWPLSSVRFGLLLLGPLYALNTLAAQLLEGVRFRRAVVEPLVLLFILWGLALLFP